MSQIELNRNDSDSAPEEAVDIENIMQDVRRQILERELPGQVQLPRTATSLPPEFYEHLFHAGLAQSRVEVELLVVPSNVPLIGPLIDRLRVKIHELVVFYINRAAESQARVNTHILQALSDLAQSMSGEEADDHSRLGGRGFGFAPRGELAALEDVYACFYLLLGREPDERSLDYWSSIVTNHHVSRAYLVDSFLSGHEFKAIWAERNNPIPVVLPGFQIFVRRNDNFVGAVIEREKRYEPHVTRVLERLLSRDDVFVDVGANIGYFTLLAASRVGAKGRVIAFEPNLSNCELIRAGIVANGFEQVIDLHAVAVADTPQQVSYLTVGVDSNGRLVNPAEAAAQEIALPTVEAVTLDDALADCKRVDVVKIDVEGTEARVWRGMQKIISQHRPVLLFEFSPILLRLTSEADPATFLEEVHANHDLYIISAEGEIAAAPDSPAAILEQQAAIDPAHLDILARPRQT